MDKRVLGFLVMVGSVAGIFSLFHLMFLSPWAPLVVRLLIFAPVGALLLIMASVGVALVTTIRPDPLDDMVELIGLDLEEPAEERERSARMKND
jgi:hypothetical protein